MPELLRRHLRLLREPVLPNLALAVSGQAATSPRPRTPSVPSPPLRPSAPLPSRHVAADVNDGPKLTPL